MKFDREAEETQEITNKNLVAWYLQLETDFGREHCVLLTESDALEQDIWSKSVKFFGNPKDINE